VFEKPLRVAVILLLVLVLFLENSPKIEDEKEATGTNGEGRKKAESRRSAAFRISDFVPSAFGFRWRPTFATGSG
jgi:hypothetical protein